MPAELQFGPGLLAAIHEQAARAYPDECCGLALGASGEVGALTRVVPIRNAQDEFHERDPVRFPRTARSAYFMEPGEVFRALREARSRDEELRVIYHSHPDAEAYFSREDVVRATYEGEPLHPGVAYLVLSVVAGKVVAQKMFHWVSEAGTFRSEEGEWARADSTGRSI